MVVLLVSADCSDLQIKETVPERFTEALASLRALSWCPPLPLHVKYHSSDWVKATLIPQLQAPPAETTSFWFPERVHGQVSCPSCLCTQWGGCMASPMHPKQTYRPVLKERSPYGSGELSNRGRLWPLLSWALLNSLPSWGRVGVECVSLPTSLEAGGIEAPLCNL